MPADLEALLVVAAVQAARHVKNGTRPPAKLPARVISVGTGTAVVLCDGATNQITVSVPASVTGVAANKRVLVEFRRPGGAVYVAAVI